MNAKLAKAIRKKAKERLPEEWPIETDYNPVNVLNKKLYVMGNPEPIEYTTYTAEMKPCLRKFVKELKRKAGRDGATVASFSG